VKRIFVALALLASASACRQIAGIHDVTFSDAAAPSGDGGSGECSGATNLITSIADYDDLSVAGGFAFVEITSAGVARCATNGTCKDPNDLLTVPATDTYQDFTLSASSMLVYTLQGPSGSGGSVHAAKLDGTGDTTVVGNLAYPAYVTTTGARTFWVDDPFIVTSDTDSVQCSGCNGVGPTPWITNLFGGAYGIYADAANVYVLADDPSSTYTLYDCPVTAACASPQTLLAGLDPTTELAQMIASDGTDLYVGRNDHADIVRVGPATPLTPIVTGTQAYAVAVDATAGYVYYGTDQASLWRVKADGSDAPTVLATCNSTNDTVEAVAVDATSVYMLLSTATGSVVVSAPK